MANAPAVEGAPLTERARRVYAEVYAHPGIAPAAIAYNLDDHRWAVLEALAQLRTRGLVSGQGQKASMTYQVCTAPVPELPPRERLDACPRCGGPVRRDAFDDDAGWCINHGTICLLTPPTVSRETVSINNATSPRAG